MPDFAQKPAIAGIDIELAQMSWEDHTVKVAEGTWLYDGAAEKPVAIISPPFDYW